MVFLYNIASHRSWEGLQLFCGRGLRLPPSQEKSPPQRKKYFLKIYLKFIRLGYLTSTISNAPRSLQGRSCYQKKTLPYNYFQSAQVPDPYSQHNPPSTASSGGHFPPPHLPLGANQFTTVTSIGGTVVHRRNPRETSKFFIQLRWEGITYVVES